MKNAKKLFRFALLVSLIIVGISYCVLLRSTYGDNIEIIASVTLDTNVNGMKSLLLRDDNIEMNSSVVFGIDNGRLNISICKYINGSNKKYENNINIDMFEESQYKYDLSIIFGTRNDDYGGTLLDRILITLKQILAFPWYNDYGLNIQVIITQYNYIPTNPFIYEEPLFIDLINQVNNISYISHINIKFINVPFKDSYPVIKKDITDDLYCPMHEFIAKNIGLRRSKSTWILVINQDNLLPNPLLKYIAKSIKTNAFNITSIYQSPRSNINKTDVQKFNNETKLSSVNCKLRIPRHRVLPAAGDFLLFHNTLLKNVGGYLEINGHWYLDSEIIIRALKYYNYNTYVIESPNKNETNHCKPLHIEHERKYTNNYDKNIILSSNNNFTKIECDPFKGLIKHWVSGNKNDIGIYTLFHKNQNGTWGLKRKIFDIYKCVFN